MSKGRILVVDDELDNRVMMRYFLESWGYEVELAGNGQEGLDKVDAQRPDLVLLDLEMPVMNGFDACDRLKTNPETEQIPVIMFTGLEQTNDKVKGIRKGADDYVVKPVDMQELVARVRVLLRRSSADAERSGPLVFADLSLDDDLHEVRRGGVAVDLTATEFRLLRYLMQNAPRVLSKAQILDHVWNYDFGGDTSNVETYISYLRKKVDAGREPMIHTMRGAGYVLKPAT